MKTQELLELAALDALGLLDEAERDQFDRAFRAAPPALQAQIRREQTRIAGDDSLLPRIEAPIGLKARVLAAWREAVEAVSNRSPARRLVGALTLLPARGVSPLWRAGAIGCAAASVVLAVAMVNIRREVDRMTDATKSIGMQEYFAKEFGARFERMSTAPTTKFVQFDPSAADVKVRALLLIDPETKTGHLYACQLPEAVYALVKLDVNGEPVRDADGVIEKLCEIRSSSESGSVYNPAIKNIEPGTSVGLVKTDGAADSLLLRGRL